MNNVKTEYMSKNNMPSSEEMSLQEFSNWIALCNALKFINHTTSMTGNHIEEKDFDYRAINDYVEAVSGDIATCLLATGGVPYKYSLSLKNKESWDIEDLNYDFIN